MLGSNAYDSCFRFRRCATYGQPVTALDPVLAGRAFRFGSGDSFARAAVRTAASTAFSNRSQPSGRSSISFASPGADFRASQTKVSLYLGTGHPMAAAIRAAALAGDERRLCVLLDAVPPLRACGRRCGERAHFRKFRQQALTRWAPTRFTRHEEQTRNNRLWPYRGDLRRTFPRIPLAGRINRITRVLLPGGGAMHVSGTRRIGTVVARRPGTPQRGRTTPAADHTDGGNKHHVCRPYAR
jgi:hypothetical protein